MESIDFSRIKGIIFDYGGTIDTRGDHWSHVLEAGYRACGVEVPLEEFREVYVYAERTLAREYIIHPEHNFLDLLEAKVAIELQRLAETGSVDAATARDAAKPIALWCYRYARTCVEEARPSLAALAERFPMMLVSNFYGNVDAVLRDFDLRKYFKGVIESAVVGVRKPDPTIFRLGVVALGLEPQQVLVVGDSLRKDILPAESIGCATAWIKGRGWTPDEDAAEHPSRIPSLAWLAAEGAK